MLDKRSLSLLAFIEKECSGGGYKIFSAEELVSSFPQELCSDSDGVSESIRALSEKGYISVKYADEREVCLSTLPKGRAVLENGREEKAERLLSEKRYFRYSFLGALIGGAAAFLFTALVLFLSGAI